MALEIREDLRKYCVLTDDGTCIEKFVCPVEGCDFTTELGPGALRMHLLLRSDPTMEKRYCEAHDKFCSVHSNELGMDVVRYLHDLPRLKAE